MSWLIEVDGPSCIGSGMCVGMASEHFELRDGVSRPLRSQVEPADEIVDAAESCPVEAITVRDAESGAVIAPEP
ncbi:ferredoxin [Saccharopolyspora lacisalsi]|uniref:Ferredoxin n=1 Tax=Halosaccharopolyspora lacisalsi TaxID=1000566 RepID=A0A839DWK2_9PSEU|nr:ferredoxin [Halosaccharopolyspora lacisalsi]MBA8825403.1 ferredoxin [Halosaccharopolyspora lacisalsi]